MSEDGKKRNWLSSAGLTGVAISALAYVAQQEQQHAFEQVQNNIATGLNLYWESKTGLTQHRDVERELALLESVGEAFPNAYCIVWKDTYSRVMALDDVTATQDENIDPDSFTRADFNNLRDALLRDRIKPSKLPLPGNLLESVNFTRRIEPCQKAQSVQTVEERPAVTPEAPTPQNQIQARVEQPSLLERLDPTPRAHAEEPPPRQPATTPVSVVLPAAAPIDAAPAVSLLNVSVFVPRSGAVRSTYDAARVTISNDLSEHALRMGGGRAGPKLAGNVGEVRYADAANAERAQEIASYLAGVFGDEHISFRAVEVAKGQAGPLTNPIEVWIPEGGTAAPSTAPTGGKKGEEAAADEDAGGDTTLWAPARKRLDV